MTDSTSNNLHRIIIKGVTLIILLLAWQVASKLLKAPLLLPEPKAVLDGLILFMHKKSFWTALLESIFRCYKVVLFIFFLGLLLGIFSSLSKYFKYIISPIIEIIRCVPVISIIILALFWLKSSSVPVFVAILMTLPMVVTSVDAGFSVVDKQMNDMAYVYKLSCFQSLFFIRLPAACPYISTAMINSCGMIWKVVAAGEVLSLPKSSLGTLLQRAEVSLETQQVFAITFLIILMSFLFRFQLKLLSYFFNKLYYMFINWYFSKPFCKVYNYNLIDKNPGDIEIKNFSLKRGEKILYKDFNIVFEKDCLTAILAKSGTGKTTLLNFIAGLLEASSGDVTAASVSYLFQEPRLICNLTVFQNILLPLLHFMPLEDAKKRALMLLSKVELLDKQCSPVSKLSGGERQRVALARAFAFPAAILLLDEPFQGQDSDTKQELYKLLSDLLLEKKRTVIMVTHDKNEAMLFASKIYLFSGKPVNKFLY